MCFILLVSAAFFWSAFEQKPTSFNLFANDYTNRMIGDFEIPAVWFQSINALFIILLAPVFSGNDLFSLINFCGISSTSADDFCREYHKSLVG